MARFKVRGVREQHFEIEVDAKKSTDAATKVGDMIRSGRLQPEEEVISEIEVKRLSS